MPNMCLFSEGKRRSLLFPITTKQETWLRVLSLTNDGTREHTCICSRHIVVSTTDNDQKSYRDLNHLSFYF